MSVEPTTVYNKSEDIVFRQIADEFILVPIRKSVADLESIYALNGTAGRVWELLDGKRSVAEITQAIVEEFDVSPQEAERDLEELLRKLRDTGSIVGA